MAEIVGLVRQVLVEGHSDEADQEGKQLPQLKEDELPSKLVTIKIVAKQQDTPP